MFWDSANPQHEAEVSVAVETETLWYVVLFNDEIHTFEEVISQVQKATGCAAGKAEDIAWTVHLDGKATVFEGEFTDCFRVQLVLNEIGLVTEFRG